MTILTSISSCEDTNTFSSLHMMNLIYKHPSAITQLTYHVLNQFDQDIHSRQRQTDEQFCNIHIPILVSDHQNGTYGRDQKHDRQSPDLPRIAIASTEVTHNK